MMLMWPDFQPNRKWTSPAHLERLDLFMTLCAKRGLDVQLCMLNGFVSGLKFIPAYIVDHSAKEFYGSPLLREPQELFFRSVGRVVARHKNFLGFDLANEIPNAWSTGKDTRTGDAWCSRMLSLCDELAPGKPHVNGAWGHWFFQDTFSATFMAQRPAIAIMHCYGRYAGAPGSLLDPPSVTLPASTAALIRAYANDPKKPVWCQEFGCTDAWNSESEIAAFIEKTVLDGIEGGVNWFTWWCSHDLNRNMEFDPAEYQFGLLTNDGKLKAQGKAFRKIAEAYRGKKVQIPAQQGIAKAPPETYAKTWPWLLQWIEEKRK
jgi:endo-1,4-beta-mannosidase